MSLLGLLLGKYLAYAGFLLLAPRLLGVAPANLRLFALRWSAVRLGTGLAGIVLVIVAGYALEAAGLPADSAFYISLYGTRALIWAAIAAAITGRHGTPWRWLPFIALGLALNSAIDLGLHAAGLDDFKFFC